MSKELINELLELTRRENLMSNKDSLEYRICLLLHLAGGFFYRTKDTRCVLLLSQRNYPKLLSLKFDGRFFGLASSQAERTIQKMHQYGYTQRIFCESLNFPNQPDHEITQLSPFGVRCAEELLSDEEMLGEIGIKNQLPSVIADVLCGSVMSSGFSTALSFYLSLVEKGNENIARAKRISEGMPLPSYVYESISLPSIEEGKKKAEKKDLLRYGSTDRVDPSHIRIPYEILKDGIRKRYKYLDFGQADLEYFIHRIGEAGTDPYSRKALVMELAGKRAPPEIASMRLKNLEKLIGKYPEALDIFVKKAEGYLETLGCNLEDIRSKGYERTYGILERLAELSKMNGRKIEDQIYIEVSWMSEMASDCTKYQISVPERIRKDEEILGRLEDHVWHFGMYCHLNHITQFDVVTYSVQREIFQDAV